MMNYSFKIPFIIFLKFHHELKHCDVGLKYVTSQLRNNAQTTDLKHLISQVRVSIQGRDWGVNGILHKTYLMGENC